MKFKLTNILLASAIAFSSESYASIPQPNKHIPNKNIQDQYRPHKPLYDLPLDIAIDIPEMSPSQSKK